MTRRIGRGGRKGQTHTATPTLRSYDVAPASDVTVTQANGTSYTVPAQSPKSTPRPSRKRGPLVCAMCGDPLNGPALFSRARGSRGKPVHGACDPTATPERVKRPKPSRQPVAAPPPRGRLSPGADPATAWIELPCTQCPAQPGERCTVRYSDGSTAEAKVPHRERTLAAKKAAGPR
ncbi:hypothetical protein ACFTXM_08510 [Streptomyces sp. NPDC056930]|uniref:zinc finger domain-containing protein n=1 Tax=Streptomyces sp. NPDC056930 TaxID=3345967 RepID=UPI0036455503